MGSSSSHVAQHKSLARRNSAPVEVIRGLFGSFKKSRIQPKPQQPRESWTTTTSEEAADGRPSACVHLFYGEDGRGPKYYLGDEEVFAAAADMGNIQGAEGKKAGKAEKKAKAKAKLAKGKSPSKAKLHSSRDTLQEDSIGELLTPSPTRQDAKSLSTHPPSTSRPVPTLPSERPPPIITESWKEARRPESLSAGRVLGGESVVGFVDSSSSSESVFTEARSGGGPASQHDAVTPLDGAATPMFSEALDLPIDAIISGYYSSSNTSTVSSRPNTLADSLQSTNSALDMLEKTCRTASQTHLDTLKKTDSRSEREKTLEGSWESGGKVPAAMLPPSSSRQEETITDTRVEESQYSSALGRVQLSHHLGEEKVGEALDVLSPEGVDLEFSEREVFELNRECLEGEQPQRPFSHGSAPHGGEESLGSFICVDLDRRAARVKTHSLGDHHDPERETISTENKLRSFSADDFELDPENYIDEEYYGENGMPQASAGGRGCSGASNAFRVSRHRKVELQPAKPSASRSLVNSSSSSSNNNTNNNSTKSRALSENCISGEYANLKQEWGGFWAGQGVCK